jgi:hypothetical protein
VAWIQRLFVASALALAVVAAGCGGGSGSGETTAAKDVFYPWVKGASREFLVRGGDNLIQYWGHDAAPAEREAASRVIHRWMRARSGEAWTVDCKYFSPSYRRSLVENARTATDGRVTDCPAALEYFGESVSGDGRNTLTGPIDSLRVKKGRGYAQWHGPERDWVLPVIKVGGRWTVIGATPVDRSK